MTSDTKRPQPFANPMASDVPVSSLEIIVSFLQGPSTLLKVAETIRHASKPEGLQSLTHPENGAEIAQAESYVADAIRQVKDSQNEAHQGLLMCSPESILCAIETLAACGLSPNHRNGEGYIVGKYSKNHAQMVAVPIPGMRGYERLIMNNGGVEVRAAEIRMQDSLDYVQGTSTVLRHTPNLTPDPTKGNSIIGAWAVIEMKDGSLFTKVLPIDEKSLLESRIDKGMQAASRPVRAAAHQALRLCENRALRILLESACIPEPENAILDQVQSSNDESELEPVSIQEPKQATDSQVFAADIQEAVILLQTPSGSFARKPGTPLSKISEDGIYGLLKWAEVKGREIPPSETEFIGAARALISICERYDITFSQLKEHARTIAQIPKSHTQINP